MATIQEINEAHTIYMGKMLNDITYRACRQLVEFAVDVNNTGGIALAVAALLKDWNRGHHQYRPHRRFDTRHFSEIEDAIKLHLQELIGFRQRLIEDFRHEEDKAKIENIFTDFSLAVGPVGAAKSMHLIAPHFFPIWDNKIAKDKYKIRLGGKNDQKYCLFIGCFQREYIKLKKEGQFESNLVKALDEFNYSVYSKEWMKTSEQLADISLA